MACKAVACATPAITYHLGSLRRATDSSDSIVWSWESVPFGETPAQSDPGNSGSKTIINLRFPGQQYDEETGLHYNQMRDYDPTTGRYMQADPIGLRAGANVYTYANMNAVENIDPKGNISFRCSIPLDEGDYLITLYHSFICQNGNCRGTGPGGWRDDTNLLGEPSTQCEAIETGCYTDEQFDACIAREFGFIGIPRSLSRITQLSIAARLT